VRLYNTDTSPVVVGHWTNPAVIPGEGADFDEETAAYLLSTGRWTETDPRAGRKAERAFKQQRDAQTQPDNKGAAA